VGCRLDRVNGSKANHPMKSRVEVVIPPLTAAGTGSYAIP